MCLREKHPDGVKAIEDWVKSGFHQLVINVLVRYWLPDGAKQSKALFQGEFDSLGFPDFERV